MGQRRKQTIQGILRVTLMRYNWDVWYGEEWKDRITELESERQSFFFFFIMPAFTITWRLSQSGDTINISILQMKIFRPTEADLLVQDYTTHER